MTFLFCHQQEGRNASIARDVNEEIIYRSYESRY